MAYYQLSKSGAQIDAALALAMTAAQQNGSYDLLTAGVAKNLQGRQNDSVDATFTRRTAGGTADIGSGNAKIKSIHGKTLVWNQVLNKGFIATQTKNDVTWTNNDDGSYTVDGTASAATSFLEWATITPNHYYFMSGAKGNVSMDYGGLYFDTGSGKIFKPSSSANLFFRVANGAQVDNITIYPQLIDLTAMFGAGNEPTTVAEFKALFPLDYYAYNAGSLLHFNGTGLKTVGFNQWDEQWESGSLDDNGNTVNTGGNIRSKNFIPVFPNTAYYINAPYTVYMRYYDADKNFIGKSDKNGNGNVSSPAIRTTAANCHYVKFYVGQSAYQNDICINLSHSGYRNGEYEPYWTSTLPLPVATYFPTGMKSAGSVYDELTEKKAITRICVVDLGTLTWSYESSFQNFITNGLQSLIKSPSASSVLPNAVCAIYNAAKQDNYSVDKTIKVITNGQVWIKDTAYSDAAAFKAAMNGVMLAYEMATPVEADVDLALTYRVDDFGTEELLPENESTPTTSPFVASILYAMNAVDTIRNMPDKVYRAFVDIKDSNDVHHTFSVVVGAIPSIDTANTKLVGIPAGVYRAVKGSEHEYSDVEVDSNGNVYIDGTLDSFAADDSSITTEKYF